MPLQYTVWASAGEVAQGPVISEGTIAIGGTSTASATVIDPAGSNRGRRVRIFCEANAYVTWGATPVAVNDGSEGRMMGSENPEYWDIPADQKIAVIQRV